MKLPTENSSPRRQWVMLPPLTGPRAWYRAIDTSLGSGDDFAEPGQEVRINPADHYVASSRSTVVLLARWGQTGVRTGSDPGDGACNPFSRSVLRP